MRDLLIEAFYRIKDNIGNIFGLIILTVVLAPIVLLFFQMIDYFFPGLHPITSAISSIILFPLNWLSSGGDPYSNCVEDRFGTPICPQ
ncbi:MAG: hypothetical protein ACD_37C00121G0003 [uncultured bacterium]|nr:MAG: hypothetical protein ACD_37C00121G0003 [uncultured bacterium]